MKIIGLCGGSGSGKTTVSELLRRCGFCCIDTDEIYHELTARPTPCLAALASEFGESIISPQGALDRRRLAEIVFAPSAEKRLEKLNEISHYYVLREVRSRIAALARTRCAAALVDAPLLFESGFSAECDLVIGVIANRALRVARICARDGITQEAAERRIDKQLDDLYIREHADYVISNDGDREALAATVDKLAKKILNFNI